MSILLPNNYNILSYELNSVRPLSCSIIRTRFHKRLINISFAFLLNCLSGSQPISVYTSSILSEGRRCDKLRVVKSTTSSELLVAVWVVFVFGSVIFVIKLARISELYNDRHNGHFGVAGWFLSTSHMQSLCRCLAQHGKVMVSLSPWLTVSWQIQQISSLIGSTRFTSLLAFAR